MPRSATWIQDGAADIDPAQKLVTLRSGRRVGYDKLVVAPGIQLDWNRVPGMSEALDTPMVSTRGDGMSSPPVSRRSVAAVAACSVGRPDPQS